LRNAWFILTVEEVIVMWIDLETWPRRPQFEYYRAMAFPAFNLCVEVDVTALLAWVKSEKASFFASFLYCLSRAANLTDAFRLRTRPEGIWLHETVHPSFVHLYPNETYGYCLAPFTPDYGAFAEAVRHVQAQPQTLDDKGRDDLIFVSCVPWIRFTGLSHPVDLNPALMAIPRFVFGKYAANGQGQITVPLSIQVHHGLMDGLHVGRFLQLLEANLADPRLTLGEGAVKNKHEVRSEGQERLYR
jgi:chloramphenicol O-acetyltransferase type A